jgi:uncharacterized protein involved in exopolysaccharide biosynthesis
LDDLTYDLEADESKTKPRRPGFPVEPRRLLQVLAENRKPLLKAFLIASAFALIASFFIPLKYESSAHLLYEGTPLLEAKDTLRAPGAFVESAIAPSRLREVRERLGWNVALDELESRVEATLEDKAAMRIVGQAGTAEDAHALTGAVLDVFLEHQASFNKKRLERLTAENRIALERAKERREEAGKARDAFRAKSGKPDVIREQDQLLERAAQLRSRAEEAAVEVAAQRAQIEELEAVHRELPHQIVASAKKGTPMDTPLAAARAELAAARASLSEQHPRVQALKERVATLQVQRKGQKNELTEQTTSSNPAHEAVHQQLTTARAERAAAQEREAALRVLLKSIKDEAESLAPEESEARQVIRELEMATARVEQLADRSAVLRDAALGPLTGFRVLSAPMLPEEAEHSKPHVLLLVLLPIVTVLLFALLLIASRLRSLTVEAPREVAWWGNGPVLGTSVWPRDPEALESFVDELEDYGVYGAGRTLVVPATEAERDIACSFALRLAEAPWLAAAILDVGERAGRDPHAPPLVTPPVSEPEPSVTPPMVAPKRLSSQGTPSTSRPPRKKTMIGLPAVQYSGAPQISTEPTTTASSVGTPEPTEQTSGPQAFRRMRKNRATVRMIVPVVDDHASTSASTARSSQVEEEAFLLTRPVPVATDETPSRPQRTVHVSTDSPHVGASNAVMRAAVRLLGDDDDEITSVRRSEPPPVTAPGHVAGVALAWNGPLSGPILRRAARLAHRVMVVVSSGMSVIDLARLQTRLGRDEGVGYVLVNVGDAYVDLHDRVGPVETFWEGPREPDTQDPRLP